jgi:hypothetical protein
MKKFTLFFCSLAIAAAMQAQIIHVPDDYPTIQLGINATNPGDTVLVAEGTYFEQISFLGKKPLMVASRFLMDGDTSHISKTIVDGSHATNPDSSSVVYFISDEDTTSILCGFTIKNGKGTIYTTENLILKEGGGVFISGSGARISHNHITQNQLDDTLTGYAELVGGAGIDCEWKEDDHWVVVDHNIIDHNSSYSSGIEAYGAGLSICYNARIINNTISYNSSIGKGYSQATAALDCATQLDWTTPVSIIVQNNVITNNYCETQYSDAAGAGAFFQKVSGNFSDNIVNQNKVSTSPYYGGAAGLFVFVPNKGTFIRNNIFSENAGDLSAGGLQLKALTNDAEPQVVLVESNYFLNNLATKGGAFATYNLPVILQNNVFSGNNAMNSGGAVFLERNVNSTHHLVTLINNSFSANTASLNGGAVCSIKSKPLIINSVLWGDSASDGREIYLYSGDSAEVAYCTVNPDFIHGYINGGGGSINFDPQFSDSVLLTTKPWSPCVDAGIASYTCSHGISISVPLYDITGIPRPAGEGYDMGAYDLQYSGEGIADKEAGVTFSALPNPFSASVNFRYTLEEPSRVILRIVDSFGRVVAVPINAFQQKGEQQIEWNSGNLPAGIYYCRLQAGENTATTKLILLK